MKPGQWKKGPSRNLLNLAEDLTAGTGEIATNYIQETALGRFFVLVKRFDKTLYLLYNITINRLEKIVVLEKLFELIVVALFMGINKLGIRRSIRQSASFVLIAKEENGKFYFLLVREMLGYLNFSGGRPDKEENCRDAAKREVKEETGLRVGLGELLQHGTVIIFGGAIKLSYAIYEGISSEGEVDPKLQRARFYSEEEVSQLGQEGKLLGPYVEQAIKSFIVWKKTS